MVNRRSPPPNRPDHARGHGAGAGRHGRHPLYLLVQPYPHADQAVQGRAISVLKLKGQVENQVGNLRDRLFRYLDDDSSYVGTPVLLNSSANLQTLSCIRSLPRC